MYGAPLGKEVYGAPFGRQGGVCTTRKPPGKWSAGRMEFKLPPGLLSAGGAAAALGLSAVFCLGRVCGSRWGREEAELRAAIIAGDYNAALRALDAGAVLEAQDEKGRTAIHHAAGEGRLKIVELLLKRGSPIHTVNHAGRTPIHTLAFWSDSPRIARMLIEAGAEVDTEDANGFTPLMYAAQQGNTEVVSELIRSGADITLTNPDLCECHR